MHFSATESGFVVRTINYTVWRRVCVHFSATESGFVIRSINYTVWRRVCVHLSAPESLQAGAVTGLIKVRGIHQERGRG